MAGAVALSAKAITRTVETFPEYEMRCIAVVGIDEGPRVRLVDGRPVG